MKLQWLPRWVVTQEVETAANGFWKLEDANGRAAPKVRVRARASAPSRGRALASRVRASFAFTRGSPAGAGAAALAGGQTFAIPPAGEFHEWILNGWSNSLGRRDNAGILAALFSVLQLQRKPPTRRHRAIRKSLGSADYWVTFAPCAYCCQARFVPKKQYTQAAVPPSMRYLALMRDLYRRNIETLRTHRWKLWVSDSR